MASLPEILTFVFFLIYHVSGKVTIKKIGMCNPDQDTPIKYTTNLKIENDKQFIKESVFSTTVDMDNNVALSVDVLMLDDDKWTLLFNQKGRLCDLQEKYAGAFAIELEKASGMSGCPFSKGEYTLQNYELDFQKFAYKDFPEGTLKVKVDFSDATNKEELGCMDIQFKLEN